MLNNQTAQKLRTMRLPAMAAEFERQLESPAMDTLSVEERIGMMVDAEWLSKEGNRIQKLTKAANLRFSDTCFANIDYRPSRRLDRAHVARLSDFEWAKAARNIILTGATGTGKTWMACAFGTEACRLGHTVSFYRVSFYRVSRLLGDMAHASATGTIFKLLAKIRKCQILILDDWGLTTLTPLESRFLLEIFEERYGEGATIISAQLPVSKWHDLFEDSTVADAVLDRIIHNSHRIELHGPSLRPAADKDLGEGAPDGA